MWLARGKGGLLFLYDKKPILCLDGNFETQLMGDYERWVSDEEYPEVTFENSPQEVEIVSKDELDALREKYEDLCGLVAEMRHLQREQDSADIQWDNLHYHESVYNRMVELQKEVDQWLNLN